MMKFLTYLTAASLLWVSAAVTAAEITPPDVLVKTTTQEVLSVLRQEKGMQGGDRKKILDLIETKVIPHFDFAYMTRSALGAVHWKDASAAQKQSLIKEFHTLLVRTYSASLSAYKDQVVEFLPFRMQPEEDDVTVKTRIKQPGGEPITVDYHMRKTSDGWRVYDVLVANVSLVTNYRGTFGNEVRQKGVDGLINSLVEKNKTGTTPKADK